MELISMDPLDDVELPMERLITSEVRGFELQIARPLLQPPRAAGLLLSPPDDPEPPRAGALRFALCAALDIAGLERPIDLRAKSPGGELRRESGEIHPEDGSGEAAV